MKKSRTTYVDRHNPVEIFTTKNISNNTGTL